jgi:hypothetical protein
VFGHFSKREARPGAANFRDQAEVISSNAVFRSSLSLEATTRTNGKGLGRLGMETAPDRNRKFKYYRLTEKGKKQLVVEVSQWKWTPGFASPA